MSSSSSISIIIGEYSKSTQNVCMCFGVAAIMIFLFMLTPLNKFMLSSIFGKVIILTILGYTLYYNVIQTNKFSNQFNLNSSILNINEWNPIKTNVLCSHIFSLFLLVFIISVIRKIF